MSVIDVQELVILDDDDYGQPEQIKRDPQLIEEAFDRLKASNSPDAMNELSRLSGKDKNRALMRQLGLIPILCKTLATANPPNLNEQQAAALHLLSCILQNLPSREEVRRKGGIDTIIKLLALQDEKQIGEVLLCAAYLADNTKNRTTLRSNGILEVAVPKMKQLTGVNLQNVFSLIASMSQGDKKTQDQVVKLGAIPIILDGVMSQDPGVRNAAVQAIGAVSSNNRKVQGLARKSKPALTAMVNMLRDPIADHRAQAASVIGYLTENDFSNQVAFQKIGVLDAITACLSNGNESLQVKEKCCGLLVALSNGNASVQKAFTAFPTLVACTQAPAAGVQAQSFNAISELCSNNSPNSDQFINHGVLQAIQNMLQSDNEIVQYRATNALYSIIRNNPTRRQIVLEMPNIPNILRALKGSGNPKVKQGAQWCLEEL